MYVYFFFFFSSRRRHTRCSRDWSSDVCSSDLTLALQFLAAKLNIACKGSDSNCIASAIAAADSFLCAHPVGSGVTANSSAWQQIKATNSLLEKYNEGMLCAPSCDTALAF